MSWQENTRKCIIASIASQLTETSPQATQPAHILTALRPHQRTLLAAARALETKASIHTIDIESPVLLTRCGVIGDRVGAGKSLVALSLVRDPPVNTSHLSVLESGVSRLVGLKHMPSVRALTNELADLSGHAFCKSVGFIEGTFYANTSLMIVPHNVIQQWEAYIRDQTTIRALFIRKTKDCAHERPAFYNDVFDAELVIVSCTMLKKFMNAILFYGGRFANIVWSRLFIDEADSITCTLRANDVSARFLWFITGSWLNMLFPFGVYSNFIQSLAPAVRTLIGDGSIAGVHGRLGIVGTSMPDCKHEAFTQIILRNADAWIDTSLLRPSIVHDTILCKAPANLDVLRGFITPAAMEALHAGDIAAAMDALGLKAASKETLVDRVTESLRADILQAEKILAFKRDIEYSSAAAKVAAIEKADAKVTRLRDQLLSLEVRIASVGGELCPICYDVPRTATLTPCCRQVFCLSCLCECVIAKPACPLCRQQIASVKQLIVIGDTDTTTETDVVGPDVSPKGVALLKLLTESSDDQRFLVFSAHEASFKGLRELLSARGIRCEMLQGSAARIERLRAAFRTGEVRVLCMNARHVGAGINLEAATHVVLYHRMNMELERQVIGRAVRFERASELRVVHLVHNEETAYNGASSSEVIMHVH